MELNQEEIELLKQMLKERGTDTMRKLINIEDKLINEAKLRKEEKTNG